MTSKKSCKNNNNITKERGEDGKNKTQTNYKKNEQKWLLRNKIILTEYYGTNSNH